jgi:hypothetical protein
VFWHSYGTYGVSNVIVTDTIKGSRFFCVKKMLLEFKAIDFVEEDREGKRK